MCDMLNKRNNIKNQQQLSSSKNLTKELMIITVYQLMENNLISPSNPHYIAFKQQIQNKLNDIDILTDIYHNIIYDSIHNDFFTSEDTMKIILKIFDEVDQYKSEYITMSKKNTSADIYDKLTNILKFPLS